MRDAALCSAGLHASLIALAIVGLPRLFPEPELPDVIEVQMVALTTPEPVTAAPPPPAKEVKPEIKPAPPAPPPEPVPPPPQAKVAPPPPPETPPEPVPEPVPEVKPEPAPEPPPEKVAKPQPEPEPAAKPEPPKAAPPPPQIAAAPPPRKPKPPPDPAPKPDPFHALLKDLARQREAEEQARPPAPKTPAQVAVTAPRLPDPSPKPSSLELRRLAASLANAVRQRVQPCWNFPVGAKDAKDMRVAIRIFLNPDGTLRGQPKVVDNARFLTEPNFRAAAESALRALRNPHCSPIKLPLQYYELWKEIVFNFDPRELLDQ